MPTHPDAIGYLKDLGHSEAIPWLEMICDEACSAGGTLTASDLNILVQLFIRRASYVRQPTAPASTLATAGAVSPASDKLETIGPFNEFKRLCDTVIAEFPKRVTVIFGANGSGKSSLCEALQILASDDAPRRPYRNVHSSTTGTPSFTYRFGSDSVPQIWTSPGPYGARASVIKYFDTGIAISNVSQAVQPGRIVELAPFKLDVFETAKEHCTSLRAELINKQSENRQKLAVAIENVQDRFRAFENSNLANLTNPTLAFVEAEIRLGLGYVEDGSLDEKIKNKTDLEKTTSEDGLKLLKGEVAAMKALLAQAEPVVSACEILAEIDPAAQEEVLKAKERELEVLAKALIPSGSTLDKLMALIRPANEICDFQETKSKNCPLCKQELGEGELDIFRQYSSLLTGELEAAITEINQRLDRAKAHALSISNANPGEWSKDSMLPQEMVEPIRSAAIDATTHFVPGGKIDQSSTQITQSLKTLVEGLSTTCEEKERLVLEAGRDRDALLKRLETASKECQSLSYAKTVLEQMDLLREVRGRLKGEEFWATELPRFSTILRKITSSAKTAHKELVVGDFINNRGQTTFYGYSRGKWGESGKGVSDK